MRWAMGKPVEFGRAVPPRLLERVWRNVWLSQVGDIYPLIVTDMCTAMPRGDCCTLLRESVDLEAGFITVKTSKTGETVQIPIFPLLRKVLEEALAKPSPRAEHYAFPHL